MDGLTIRKEFYRGNGLCLPELSSERIVLQMYNSSADICSSKEIQKKLGEYGNLFRVLVFSVNAKALFLEKLEMLTLGMSVVKERLEIRERFVLYTNNTRP